MREALRTTIEEAGLTIDDAAVDAAAEATSGYPFMIQLVGYQTWSRARGETISIEDIRGAVPAARMRLGSLVHEPTSRGNVDFTIPYLRDYLREHAARYEMVRRRP